MQTQQSSNRQINITDPGAEISIKLPVNYTSYWEEGDVYSAAVASLGIHAKVDAETSDCGDDYEHLIREEISFSIHGKVHEFAVNDGEMSEQDSLALKGALCGSKVILSLTTCTPYARADIPENTWSDMINGYPLQPQPGVLEPVNFLFFQDTWFALEQLHTFSDSSPSCIPSGWQYLELPNGIFLVAKKHDGLNQIRVGLVLAG